MRSQAAPDDGLVRAGEDLTTVRQGHPGMVDIEVGDAEIATSTPSEPCSSTGRSIIEMSVIIRMLSRNRAAP